MIYPGTLFQVLQVREFCRPLQEGQKDRLIVGMPYKYLIDPKVIPVSVLRNDNRIYSMGTVNETFISKLKFNIHFPFYKNPNIVIILS